MFVADRLIYLQLQRTGSGHITSLLRRCVGGVEFDQHAQLRGHPGQKLVVGSIRDPWDWYVSLWAYGCGGKGALYEKVAKRELGPRRFVREALRLNYRYFAGQLAKPVRVWRECYRDSDDPACFRRWLRTMYEPSMRELLLEGYPRSPISKFAGFMTFRYCRLYVRHAVWSRTEVGSFPELVELDRRHNIMGAVIRSERLEDDLITALDKAGYEVNDKMRALIYRSRKSRTNASSRREASYYYDEEAKQLVYDREKLIVQKYGYDGLMPRAETGEARGHTAPRDRPCGPGRVAGERAAPRDAPLLDAG